MAAAAAAATVRGRAPAPLPSRARARASTARCHRAATRAAGGLWYVDEGKPKGKRGAGDAKGDVVVETDALFASKYDKPVMRVGAEGQSLPLPEMRIVSDKKMRKVQFVSATEDADDCPAPDGLPEVALIGRSNVGKSSLLNLLTEGASGALVSSKPGTTQRINHYLVNYKWWIVDLPGYGYAEATEDETAKWEAFTKDYFVTRSNLAGVLLLIDASVPPQAKDAEYADWLIENNVPFTIVFTKCDRDKPGMPSVEENKAEFEARLEERWHRSPSMIPTSSVNADGREDVLKFISSIILFRRRKNEELKNSKRRARVNAMKNAKREEKPQRHRERKPKPAGVDDGPLLPNQAGYVPRVKGKSKGAGGEWSESSKERVSMESLIAQELADIESEKR